MKTARKAGLAGCHCCNLVSAVNGDTDSNCPRCGASLHQRKPDSIARTWALLIAAYICYVPAMLLPITATTTLGSTQEDTIMSGVIYFLLHGDWPVALVIFVASVIVPVAKLIILTFLLISIQLKSQWRPYDRTRLYRLTEAVGRWSMTDIYVVTILVALVSLGNIATIEARTGAIFFGAVVIITMVAALTFDPRVIWDSMESDT